MVSCLIIDKFSHDQSYVCSHAKYKHNSFTQTSLEGGVAVLGCQLDHLELTKTQGSGYTYEGFSLNGSFEVGFKVERPSLSLNQLSGASPHKGRGRRKLLLFSCLLLLLLASSFLHWH